jgi:hypothetical protein
MNEIDYHHYRRHGSVYHADQHSKSLRYGFVN